MEIACGTVLADRYRVEQCLGRGGMGSVWCAQDLRLQRSVAVKLAAASADSSAGAGGARRRMRREARALAALSEPGIARVYDLVQADRDVCLIMELVEGESLAARLARQPRLPVPEALEIARQCAQALEAAHRIGIVHRDVKPSNIMLGPRGAKMVDFGIAAHVGEAQTDTTRTMPRSLMGTAAYLAPERALGLPAGPAADFYSLGVVLYRMLAGYLPYQADEALAVLYAHVATEPEPLPADVPEPAAMLCLRMLDKSPEKRPTKAAEIVAAQRGLSAAVALPRTGAPTAMLRRGLAFFGRGTFGRRGAVPLIAASSGTVAALVAAAAWILVNQSGQASAVSPVHNSTSVARSAPTVVPPSAVLVNALPSNPSTKPTATAKAVTANGPRHSGGGDHGTHGGGSGHGHGHGGDGSDG